jgi:tetratricopeptide (TPR) repeat protein
LADQNPARRRRRQRRPTDTGMAGAQMARMHPDMPVSSEAIARESRWALMYAISQGRFVAFAGAGLSAAYGRPGWSKLVYELLDDLRRAILLFTAGGKSPLHKDERERLEDIQDTAANLLSVNRERLGDADCLQHAADLIEEGFGMLSRASMRPESTSPQIEFWRKKFILRQRAWGFRQMSQVMDWGYRPDLFRDLVKVRTYSQESESAAAAYLVWRAIINTTLPVESVRRGAPPDLSHDDLMRVAEVLADGVAQQDIRQIVRSAPPAEPPTQLRSLTIADAKILLAAALRPDAAGLLQDLFRDAHEESAVPPDLWFLVLGAAAILGGGQERLILPMRKPHKLPLELELETFVPPPHARPLLDPIKSLIDDVKVRRFLTTNYDVEIERTIETLGFRNLTPKSHFSPVLSPASSEAIFIEESTLGLRARASVLTPETAGPMIDFAAQASAMTFDVFHLHGRAGAFDPLVVTEGDYRALYARRDSHTIAVDHALRLTFGGNPVLFVGSSVREADILRPLREFADRSAREDHVQLFALLPAEVSKAEIDSAAYQLKARYGVNSHFYGVGPWPRSGPDQEPLLYVVRTGLTKLQGELCSALDDAVARLARLDETGRPNSLVPEKESTAFDPYGPTGRALDEALTAILQLDEDEADGASRLDPRELAVRRLALLLIEALRLNLRRPIELDMAGKLSRMEDDIRKKLLRDEDFEDKRRETGKQLKKELERNLQARKQAVEACLSSLRSRLYTVCLCRELLTLNDASEKWWTHWQSPTRTRRGAHVVRRVIENQVCRELWGRRLRDVARLPDGGIRRLAPQEPSEAFFRKLEQAINAEPGRILISTVPPGMGRTDWAQRLAGLVRLDKQPEKHPILVDQLDTVLDLGPHLLFLQRYLCQVHDPDPADREITRTTQQLIEWLEAKPGFTEAHPPAIVLTGVEALFDGESCRTGAAHRYAELLKALAAKKLRIIVICRMADEGRLRRLLGVAEAPLKDPDPADLEGHEAAIDLWRMVNREEPGDSSYVRQVLAALYRNTYEQHHESVDRWCGRVKALLEPRRSSRFQGFLEELFNLLRREMRFGTRRDLAERLIKCLSSIGSPVSIETLDRVGEIRRAAEALVTPPKPPGFEVAERQRRERHKVIIETLEMLRRYSLAGRSCYRDAAGAARAMTADRIGRNQLEYDWWFVHPRLQGYVFHRLGAPLLLRGDSPYFGITTYTSWPRDLPTPPKEAFQFLDSIAADLLNEENRDAYDPADPLTMLDLKPFRSSPSDPADHMADNLGDLAQRLRAAFTLIRSCYSIGVVTRRHTGVTARFDDGNHVRDRQPDHVHARHMETYRWRLRRLLEWADELEAISSAVTRIGQILPRAPVAAAGPHPRTEADIRKAEELDRKNLVLELSAAARPGGEWARAIAQRERRPLEYDPPFYAQEVIWLLNEGGTVSFLQGNLYDAVHLFRRAETFRSTWLTDDLETEHRLRLNSALVDIDLGRFDRAQNDLDKILGGFDTQESRERVPRYEVLQTLASGYKGLIGFMRGSLSDGERSMKRAATDLGRRNELRAASIFHRHLADLKRSANDLESAGDHLRQAIAFAENVGHMDIVHQAYLSRVRLRMHEHLRGQGVAGRRPLQDMKEDMERRIREVEVFAREMDIPRLRVEASLARSTVNRKTGDSQGAAEAAREAVRLATRFGMRIRKIQGLIDLGLALRDRGDHTTSNAVLTAAMEDATRCDYQTAMETAAFLTSET